MSTKRPVVLKVVCHFEGGQTASIIHQFPIKPKTFLPYIRKLPKSDHGKKYCDPKQLDSYYKESEKDDKY